MTKKTTAPETPLISRPPPVRRRLLSRRQMLERVPLSYPSIWKRIIAGTFPRGKNLDGGNGRKIGWYEDEIEAWMNSLPDQVFKSDAKEQAGA